MYSILIQFPEVLRLVYGPLSTGFCFFSTIIRAACIMEMFLFYNCIAMTRCIYIFYLKNPAAFNDDFWYRFLSIWIRGCSLFVCGVWYYLAGKYITDTISTLAKKIAKNTTEPHRDKNITGTCLYVFSNLYTLPPPP